MCLHFTGAGVLTPIVLERVFYCCCFCCCDVWKLGLIFCLIILVSNCSWVLTGCDILTLFILWNCTSL